MIAGEVNMDINKKVEGGKMTIQLSGRLDTTTAPELEKVLDFTGINSVLFDIEDLQYVSSAGLRVILMVQKNMKGNFTIKIVKPEIMEIFEITGFVDILNIE